ncbi:MAG: amino acid adenylation domain-containing protein, partial [bacterium]|nr:amino acid adenylation domain-containing protein [bacterium]
VSDRKNNNELRDWLSAQFPAYMVPAYFIPLEKMPLTPNGKLDRRALPAPMLQAGEDYTPPRDQTDGQLIEIWLEVLSGAIDWENPSSASIGIDDDFFRLGGHSLKGTVMAAKIHQRFHVQLPLARLFATPTVRGLADYIKEAGQARFDSIEPVEERDYYPLSPAQKRMYVLQQMEAAHIGYNIPQTMPLALADTADIDPRRLEETFKRLIARHESLRTSFHMVNDEPVQKVHDDVEFEIEFLGRGEPMCSPLNGNGNRSGSHGGLPLQSLRDFVRPFDLSQAPLLRVRLAKGTDAGILLMTDMHHIISDGVSSDVLMKDFIALYAGEELSPLRIQYKDASQWQTAESEAGRFNMQETFWLQRFEGEIPVLQLPLDYPRPAVQGFAGANFGFGIPPGESDALRALALESNSTTFMMLLALTSLLMSKLSGQEDLVIGTPVAGRRHADLEKIIGMFVNTLPIRNYPGGKQSFSEFLTAIRTETLECFENQEYPFEELVDRVDIERDAGRNPLFDVLFSLHNVEEGSPASAPESAQHRYAASKFDITVRVMDNGKRFYFNFNYNTSLFRKESVETFAVYLKHIVSHVVAEPSVPLADIQLMTEEEKQRVLYQFNDTQADYPRETTVHQLFQTQVEKSGRSAAVTANGERESGDLQLTVTYDELNTKANRLARKIQDRGIDNESIVAILSNPSIEMIVAILAVLKTGNCYLPLDPLNPGERLDYMLEDSETELLLIQTGLPPESRFSGNVLDIDEPGSYHDDGTNLALTGEPGTSAYMIYTSGTTGKPKGVQIKHQNLVNYSTWFAAFSSLTGEDKSLLTSSFAFDLGYTSIYPCLLTGGELHLLPRESYMFPGVLLDYIHHQSIRYLKMTPSLFSTLVSGDGFTGDKLSALRLVVLGGEAIRAADVAEAYRRCSHLKIMNHYGPTEVTIGCIARYIDSNELDAYVSRPTIGKPISNTQAYILDNDSNPVPVGIAGELCLSGAGVAKGYFKRPELTKEKFELYHTGDRARWLEDGNIEFLGRIDQQVKVRGYRIELAEIENQLAALDSVKEAVVIARKDSGGENVLCAYVTGQVSEGLKEQLGRVLPDYMVPAYIVPLEKIPLTPNGKLDRRALPEPGLQAVEDYTPPRDGVERELLRLWREVLSRVDDSAGPAIGIDDNFFRLGGHSLRGAVLAS